MFDLSLRPRLLAPSATVLARNGEFPRTRFASCLQGNFWPKNVHLILLKRHDAFDTGAREGKYICCGLERANLAVNSDRPVTCPSMQKRKGPSVPPQAVGRTLRSSGFSTNPRSAGLMLRQTVWSSLVTPGKPGD